MINGLKIVLVKYFGCLMVIGCFSESFLLEFIVIIKLKNELLYIDIFILMYIGM